MRRKLTSIHQGVKQFRQLPRGKRTRKLRIASKHPHAVPFFTFAILIVLSVALYGIARQTNKLPPAHDAKIVIISHDHEQQIVPAQKATVGSLLQKLDITLHEGDVVEPAANTNIDQDQFRINIYRAVPVQVVDGDNKTNAFSAARTPRSIANQAGQNLYPEDKVATIPTQDFVKSGAIGEQVVINRATPVNVDLYGTPVVLRTHAKTVGALIKEKKIVITKDDKLSTDPSTPIVANQQIAVLRTGTKVETVAEDIAMPVQKIPDASLAYGTNAVRQQGTPGQQTVTYQVTLRNNVEVTRTIIQKVVTKEPVKQIEVIGSNLGGIKGDMGLAGIAPGDYQYVDYIVSHESGWNPTASNGSGAYGLCQALPGSKMGSAGSDWATSPVTQLRWCNGYATGRFGSWSGAYNYWLSHHYW
ncbi:MAG: hypothetical protein JWO35_482 [Candidatus Saccharibacteria bacterium]|nr:hypothetical protein [Candidatus Saccharibacteria bacterium]